VGDRYAGAIVIGSGAFEEKGSDPTSGFRDVQGDSGVIVSVVNSVIDGAGGVLQRTSNAQGTPIYRVGLPAGSTLPQEASRFSLITELGPYVANWAVLLARPAAKQDNLVDLLRKLSVNVRRADSIVSLLAHLEENLNLDAVILDQQLLGAEPRAVVKAVLRLSPSSAFVVVGRNAGAIKDLSADIAFVKADDPPDRILMGMVEARSMAARRKA